MEKDFVNTTRSQHAALLRVLLPAYALWLCNGLYLGPLARASIALFWLVDLLTWVGLPAVAATYLQRNGLGPARYGLRRGVRPWPALAGLTVPVFLTTQLAFVWTRLWTWEAFGRPAPLFVWPNTFPEDPVARAVAVAYTACSAGLVERILFIGLPWLLYSGLRSKPAAWRFAVLVSLLFGASHWEQGPHIVVAAWVVNVIGCFWYFRLRTLWPIIAVHALIDALAFS